MILVWTILSPLNNTQTNCFTLLQFHFFALSHFSHNSSISLLMWTILSAPRYFSDKLLHTFTFFALSYLFAFFTFSHVPCITLLADFLCEQSLNPPLDNSETNCYSIASAETWKELETFERHKFAFTTREKFTDRGNSAQLKSSSTFKFWRKTYEWVAQLGCTYRYSKKTHYRNSSWKKKRKKAHKC